MENENLRPLYLSRSARKGVLTRKINKINEIIQHEPSEEAFVTLETLEKEYANAFLKFKEEHERLHCQLVESSEIDKSFFPCPQEFPLIGSSELNIDQNDIKAICIIPQSFKMLSQNKKFAKPRPWGRSKVTKVCFNRWR